MKFPRLPHRLTLGFTLVELLCLTVIMGLLVALLLPALALGKDRANRLVCVNNEREQGVAFHLFLHDHDSKFPMAVSVDDGGSKEFSENDSALGGPFYLSYRHFQVLSNYSTSPRELVCPTDNRRPAENMSGLENRHLSYFVAINTSYNDPESILTGDRNVTVQTKEPESIQLFEPGSRLHWTRELHRYKGDVLFSDGHVELWNQLNLAADLRGRGQAAVVALPSVRERSAAGNSLNRPVAASPSTDKPNREKAAVRVRGVFLTVIAPVGWFWLCLLVLLALAEMWRRRLKDQQAKTEAGRAASKRWQRGRVPFARR